MKLFTFASRNEKNIKLGFDSKLWAVATVSFSAMAARITKAEKYMEVGDCGLLYSNITHSFTVPFIVRSKADPNRVVTDIWPEPWRLPFSIEPLGDPSRQVHMHSAQSRWPILRNSTQSSVSAAMNFTGTTVFVPKVITQEDWDIVLHDLATGS